MSIVGKEKSNKRSAVSPISIRTLMDSGAIRANYISPLMAADSEKKGFAMRVSGSEKRKITSCFKREIRESEGEVDCIIEFFK